MNFDIVIVVQSLKDLDKGKEFIEKIKKFVYWLLLIEIIL